MKRLFGIFLVMLLLFSGCSRMLNRSVYKINTHVDVFYDDAPQGTVINTYVDLQRVLSGWIRNGSRGGSLNFQSYDGSVDTDIEKIIAQVPSDSYGLYVGAYISVTENTPLFNFSIIYNRMRTEEELKSIVKITANTQLSREIENAMTEYRPYLIVELSDYGGTTGDIELMVKELYKQNPMYAIGFPQTSIEFYKSATGLTFIADIRFNYGEEQIVLQKWQEIVKKNVTSIVETIDTSLSQSELLLAVSNALREKTVYNPESPGNIYSAVVNGESSSEGFAFTLKALCDSMNIPCVIIGGERDGEPWFWNIVTLDGSNFHTDCVLTDGELLLGSDMFMREKGYFWDSSQYPACPEIPDGTEPEEGEEP